MPSDEAARYDDLIESPAEQSLWDAYLGSNETRRVVTLVPQYQVERYRLDFGDRWLQMGIEVDGLEHHRDQAKFMEDQQRQRDLQAQGWLVVRFAAKQALDDPDECLAQIRRSAGVRREELGWD